MKRICSISLAAALVFAVGCGDDDDNNSGAGSEASEPATLAIEATAQGKRKAIEVPETVEAGVVEITLTNGDEVPREAQIVRVTGDQTPEDVLKVINKEGGPIPEFIEDGGGVAPVEPGQTATVVQPLAPGRHVVFDTGTPDEGEGPDNAERGAVAEFTVEGEAGDTTLPEPEGGTITAVDFDFRTEGLTAGRNVVRFENEGEQLHHALLFPMEEGASIEEVRELFTSEEEPSGKPPVDFENHRGTAVIDGGIAQNVELDLESGRYAAVCFIQNREGGPPHAAMGMVTEVEVE